MTVEERTVRGYFDPYAWRPDPPRVTLDPENFAHGVWRAVAVTLAEPIRKAFHEHYDECSQRPDFRGTAYCDECTRLMRLYPRGEWGPPRASG